MSDRDYGSTGGSTGGPGTSTQEWVIEPSTMREATESGASSTQESEGAVGTVQEKAGQAVETAKEKVGQVTDQASTKVDAGMDKAAGGLQTIADTIRDKAPDGGQGGGVGSVVATTADTLESAAHYLRDKDTDQLMTELEGLVRRKPVESLVAAAALGFVLSKVLR